MEVHIRKAQRPQRPYMAIYMIAYETRHIGKICVVKASYGIPAMHNHNLLNFLVDAS